MEKIFDLWLSRISSFSFLLVVLTIPFPSLVNITCALFETCAIVSFVWQKKTGTFVPQFDRSAVLLFLLACYPMIDTLFFHVNVPMEVAVHKAMIIRLQMWLMPLAMILMLKYAPDVRQLLQWLLAGNVAMAVVVIFTFVGALISDFQGLAYSRFNVESCFQGSVMLCLHRTYLCLNLLIGMMASLQLFLICSNSWKYRMQLLVVDILFGLIIFYSGSRVSLLCYLLVMLATSLSVANRLIHNKKLVIAGFLVSMMLAIFLLASQDRVQVIYNKLISGQFDWTSLDPRFRIWHCVGKFIDQCPLWGMGTDQFRPLLLEQYKLDGFVRAMATKDVMGLHNQFLENYLEIGVVGVLMLFSYLASLFNRKRMILSVTLILVLVAELNFESVLGRFYGVVTFVGITLMVSVMRRSDQSSLQRPSFLPIGRSWLCALLVILIVCFTVKFYFGKKKIYFSNFQHYLTEETRLPLPVPKEIEGKTALKVDSSVRAEQLCENSYLSICFDQFSVFPQNKVHYIIFVYVSPDFDGTSVQITTTANLEDVKNTFYDMSRKGTWQKLEIEQHGVTGITIPSLGIRRNGHTDFKSLKGYVLYVQPEIVCK